MEEELSHRPAGAASRAFTLRQIVEVAIILGAVFGADIALARVVDVALDAIHGDVAQ